MTARLRLILGKYPVTSVAESFGLKSFTLKLGDAKATITHLPAHVDIRVGDLLTLYTDVLTKERPNAIPLSTPQ